MSTEPTLASRATGLAGPVPPRPSELAAMEALDFLRVGPGCGRLCHLTWPGRIFDPHDASAETAGIPEFTRLVTGDPAWTATIVPVRDGLLVARLADG